MAAAPPPPDVKTCPAAPAVVGRLKLKVPAAACGCTVTTPLVVPARLRAPVPVPAAPSVIMEVPLVVKPALVFGVAPAPLPRTKPLLASRDEEARVPAAV